MNKFFRYSNMMDHIDPILIGIFAFYIFAGFEILDPTNIAWLASGDPAQHFIGWHTFRQTEWSWPLGLNPDYGAELSNAIVYTDSIPLMALFFKIFDPWLPEVFQYSGWWLAICFVLQAVFAWKLIGLATSNWLTKVLGTALFVLMPALAHRMIYHISLTAHFLVLAGLYLCLNKNLPRKTLAWVVLIGVTALVHPYILAMVLALWLADLWWRYRWNSRTGDLILVEMVLGAVLILMLWWASGYFTVTAGASSSGFGYFRANLLGFLDPETRLSHNWSSFLPNIGGGKDDYEGFWFLGSGCLLIVFSAVAMLFVKKKTQDQSIKIRGSLLLVVLLMAAFAVSNRIGFGAVTWEIPIPENLESLANIFRASGRMIWPAMYLIILGSLYVLINRLQKQALYPLLLIAVVLQIVDTQSAALDNQKIFRVEPQTEIETSLTGEFWGAAAERYSVIRALMPKNESNHWLELSKLAVTQGMEIDAVYLSRMDSNDLKRLQERAQRALNERDFEEDSLYAMNEHMAKEVLTLMHPEDDLLIRFDDLFVLAPGWGLCDFCPQSIPMYQPATEDHGLRLGEALPVNSQSGQGLLRSGWSDPESWGTWNDGVKASIVVPITEDIQKAKQIILDLTPYIAGDLDHQVVVVYRNHELVGVRKLKAGGDNTIAVSVTKNIKEQSRTGSFIRIDLEVPGAKSPRSSGLSKDARTLGVAIKSISLR